jgi:hypothetical protein
MQSHPGAEPTRRGARPAIDAAGWFLFLGLALRLAHYLWNHTIWYDEAVLLFNILGKDCSRLMGPLDYEVAAPPFYLWGLRAIAVAFGDHPYLWRFPSFVLSCLTLVLMTAVARRVLRPAPAALLVGMVAFSNGFVWLGCNVKPYILDACLASGLLYAYVRTEGWAPARRLLAFTAAAPLLLCASYPAVFLYAGLLLAFLPAAWRGGVGTRAAYAGLAAAVLATFACLYLGPIRAQRVPGLVAGWMNKFPDTARPASVPGWVAGNTFLVFHYCYNPVGAGCVLLAAAGAWRCLRGGRAGLACVCLGPVAACLLAAFAKAYPYSSNRLMLFAAPGIGLMTALGAPAALAAWRRRPAWAGAALAAVLLLPEAGLCLLRLHTPWVQPDGAGASRFVKEQRRPGDLVATEGGTFYYFFFGEARPLAEAAAGEAPAGRRVWVVLDQNLVAQPRDAVLSAFRGPGWELLSETRFLRASVFLFVRAGPGESARGAADRGDHPRPEGLPARAGVPALAPAAPAG